jgi:hypothetical protein
MLLIKYKLWRLLISYMFRYRSTILSESSGTEEYKPKTRLLPDALIRICTV